MKTIHTPFLGYLFAKNINKKCTESRSNNFRLYVKIIYKFSGYKDKPTRATDKALLSAFETMKEPATSRQSLASEVEVGSTNGQDKDTPHVKKRHRRMKSSGVKKDGDEGESLHELFKQSG